MGIGKKLMWDWFSKWNYYCVQQINSSRLTTDNWVTIVVISATIGAAAHWNNPAGLGHLIVDLAQGGGHFVREGTSNDHDVGLARTGTENDAETIEIITGSTCRMKEDEIKDKGEISGMFKKMESMGEGERLAAARSGQHNCSKQHCSIYLCSELTNKQHFINHIPQIWEEKNWEMQR